MRLSQRRPAECSHGSVKWYAPSSVPKFEGQLSCPSADSILEANFRLFKTLTLIFVLYSNCSLPTTNVWIPSISTLSFMRHDGPIWRHYIYVVDIYHLRLLRAFSQPTHPYRPSRWLTKYLKTSLSSSDPCNPGVPEPIQFYPNTLPNLASLFATSYFSLPLLMSPTNEVRPLRILYLSMHDLTEGIMRIALFGNFQFNIWFCRMIRSPTTVPVKMKLCVPSFSLNNTSYVNKVVQSIG